jgi:hypothetical protein
MVALPGRELNQTRTRVAAVDLEGYMAKSTIASVGIKRA